MTSQLSPDNRLTPVPTAKRLRDLRSPAFFQMRRGSAVAWFRILLLIAIDVSLLFLAWRGAGMGSASAAGIGRGVGLSFLPVVLLAIGIFTTVGLYGEGSRWRDYSRVVQSLVLVNLLVVIIDTIERSQAWLPTYLWFGVLSLTLTVLGRFVVDRSLQTIRRIGVVRHPIFVFCQPHEASQIVPLLSQRPHHAIAGWNDVCWLSEQHRESTIRRLERLGVSEVFLCSPLPTRELMLLYWDLRNAGMTLHLSIVVNHDRLSVKESKVFQIPELFSSTFAPPLIAGIDFWIKRSFDFCAAALFLLIASPVYLLIAILIKLDSPGSIFFRQTRIGLHNRSFQVWKFRTMVANAPELQKELELMNETSDGVLFKIKNDPRITRVGKVLRRYSLDELPQIFNILLGEMSFVGPRPLPVRDVEKFSESYFIRHAVLPGITGMWQISGRSNIDNFGEVLNLDMMYIKDWSLWLDLKIIFQTVSVVLRKTGAY